MRALLKLLSNRPAVHGLAQYVRYLSASRASLAASGSKDEAMAVYEEAIDDADWDLSISVEDKVNHAFGLLATSKPFYYGEAFRLFRKAEAQASKAGKLDKHKEAIDCGMRVAKSPNERSDCFHYFKGGEYRSFIDAELGNDVPEDTGSLTPIN